MIQADKEKQISCNKVTLYQLTLISIFYIACFYRSFLTYNQKC